MRLLFWIALFVMAVGCDFAHSHRAKRAVAFRKGSTFFVVFTVCDNAQVYLSVTYTENETRNIGCGGDFRKCMALYGQYKKYFPNHDDTCRHKGPFMYRLNYKINSIPWTTIFAQASGFKVAWPLPDGTRSRRSLPDLHSFAEHMYESHGFDGHACLVQNICEALNYARRRGGAIGKILKLLVSASNSNWTHAENPLVDCEQHRAPCPLQLISVDGFSEL